jgi:hypothetical protein
MGRKDGGKKADEFEVVFLPAKDFNQQTTCYD